jgi:hypothetical protein
MRAISGGPRILLFAILAIAAGGCSAYDFFGYEDNAPLHVVGRPDDYPSARFGAEIAPTSTRGEERMDLMGVSAGEGTPTVFYRLASGGHLVDVIDPWDEHEANELQAEKDGSGSSLVGLPLWGPDLVSGCVAIGEAGQTRWVRIYCLETQATLEKLRSAEIPVESEEMVERFGHQLAGIRPTAGSSAWLLAAASEYFAVVYSSASQRSEKLVPVFDGVENPGKLTELAAGRLADGRIFVAATTADESVEPALGRVHLFVQQAPGGTGFEQRACLNRTGEPGFGGVMTSGDLDGDGSDELLVSSGLADGRSQAVDVWTVSQLIDAAPICHSDAPPPPATLTPGDGPLDIDCDEGCDFGLALEVGEIATDDDGPEVIVGAPGARVDGKGQAGAVYVYRGADLLEPGAEVEVAGRVAHSSPTSHLRFGGGLAVAPMAGRNELLVGETGKGRVVITYCTGVGEDIEQGADVTKDASGTVKSTRCRP